MKMSQCIKTEPFDLMQYFYGTVHDPLIHCYIKFAGHLDEQMLVKAVTLSLEAIPVIRCCFDSSSRRPRWQERSFSGEDIVSVIRMESDDAEQDLRLLTSTIDIAHEPQLRIFLIKRRQTDAICAIINHMVCDGAGFKEYLYLLGSIYTGLERGHAMPDIRYYTRSAGQIFKGFGLTGKMGILFSKSDLSAQKQKQAEIHFDGDEGNPFIITRSIAQEDLGLLKGFCREHDVTVNDVFLTAYVRFLNRKTGIERIIVPCPVDLRKYLTDSHKHGICNLTSNYICDTSIQEDEMFSDTLYEVSRQMKRQKESDGCLKPIMMLLFAFAVIPFGILHRSFSKIFKIPVTSYTNLGVVDKARLGFGDIGIKEVFLTGAIKHTPYFQIALSTYNNVCTISCNLFGTPRDQMLIGSFLDEIIEEVITAVKKPIAL